MAAVVAPGGHVCRSGQQKMGDEDSVACRGGQSYTNWGAPSSEARTFTPVAPASQMTAAPDTVSPDLASQQAYDAGVRGALRQQPVRDEIAGIRVSGIRHGRFTATDIFDPARSARDRPYGTGYPAAPTDGAFAPRVEMMPQMADCPLDYIRSGYKLAA